MSRAETARAGTTVPPPRIRKAAGGVFPDVAAEVLRQGYSVSFSAPGQSMVPTILPGEKITVAPAEPSALRVGDIVLYRCPRGVIAHRVVRIEGRSKTARGFILRGDSSGSCDEPVESGQILGKVTAVERAGRRVELAGRGARAVQKTRLSVFRFKAWCRDAGIIPARVRRIIARGARGRG